MPTISEEMIPPFIAAHAGRPRRLRRRRLVRRRAAHRPPAPARAARPAPTTTCSPRARSSCSAADEVARWGRDFDVLLTPTSAILPPVAGAILEAQHATPDAARARRRRERLVHRLRQRHRPARRQPAAAPDRRRPARRRSAHRRPVGGGDADPPLRPARTGAALGRKRARGPIDRRRGWRPSATRRPEPAARNPDGFEQITTDLADRILTITLNRPERLNAWTATMGRELIEAFDRADADDDVRAIIVTGAGRGYCAGADLAAGGETFDYGAAEELAAHPPAGDVPRDNGGQFTLRIFSCTKPVIARDQRPRRRRRRDDDAADGRPPRRRRRAHGLRLRAPRHRARGLLQLVPAARRRHQPRDGVGLDRPRLLRPGGARRRAAAQPALQPTSCSTPPARSPARSPTTRPPSPSRSRAG